jgi:hypothetical protein
MCPGRKRVRINLGLGEELGHGQATCLLLDPFLSLEIQVLVQRALGDEREQVASRLLDAFAFTKLLFCKLAYFAAVAPGDCGAAAQARADADQVAELVQLALVFFGPSTFPLQTSVHLFQLLAKGSLAVF